MKLVSRVLNGEASYEGMDGDESMVSLGQVRSRRDMDESKPMAYPKRWIKDCWSDYHGQYTPLGFKSSWAFAQKVFDLCKMKGLSPAVLIPRLPKEPHSGMQAYLRGAVKWLERKENEESFDQWIERIKR